MLWIKTDAMNPKTKTLAVEPILPVELGLGKVKFAQGARPHMAKLLCRPSFDGLICLDRKGPGNSVGRAPSALCR
jgi:hypothetical protein